ncbi:hypothetical protein AVEN_224487-1 [Araneus ventricosus]|uniref:Uncharacterized protein n=1 Tax=Araneus ventricosus TaxID=182803 RepID=A0A4Y2L5M7_ARAVE|nr:hypothetical protein AVEN_224487-1 [Araneus ventricosus]
MHKSLSAFGKLTGSSVATTDGSHMHSRLFIYDKLSGLMFLVDSVAAVSRFLKRLASTSETSDIFLYAENGSQIRTLGLKKLELDFGLRRRFSFRFIIAENSHPIIGEDFWSVLD